MAIIKKLVKKIISKFGYHIYSKNISLYNPNSMETGLHRMRELKIFPDIIVDVGAAVGGWTRTALEVWPAAKYELVEPLAEQQDVLKKLQSDYPNVAIHQAVAGEDIGEVEFDVSDDLHGSGVYASGGDHSRKVGVLTIDSIVNDAFGSVMIKLDTHGYELPILKGAQETLKKTSLLVIEVYGFHVSPTCLLFHELTNYLFDRGFRMIDIVDVMRRPTDAAFWQADAFYIRKEHPVFTDNSFR